MCLDFSSPPFGNSDVQQRMCPQRSIGFVAINLMRRREQGAIPKQRHAPYGNYLWVSGQPGGEGHWVNRVKRMTPQQIVEELDCEGRIFSLSPECALNLGDFSIVVVQLEARNDVNLA